VVGRRRARFWEFLKFFHATNHQWSSQLVTINNDAWKKIKPEQPEGDRRSRQEARARSSGFSAFQADKDSSRKDDRRRP